jgi:hypothetical protein
MCEVNPVFLFFYFVNLWYSMYSLKTYKKAISVVKKEIMNDKF